MASRYGQLETVRTLLDVEVDKEAKDKVRNLMMMMMTWNMYDVNGDDVNDDDDIDNGKIIMLILCDNYYI